MKKLARVASAASTALACLAFSSPVAAYSYDYSYDVADTTLGSSLCLGNIFVSICCGLGGLVLFAFNIWMLIDVIQRDEKVLPGKVKWLLVVLLIPFGSVAYYFMRKRVLDAMK